MSLSKKISRKKTTEKVKAGKKIAKKITDAAIAGKRIAEFNKARILEYVECFTMPTIAYIMHKHFGFGFAKLEKLTESIQHIADVFKAKQEDGIDYIDLEGLWIGLEDEGKFVFERYQGYDDKADDCDVRSWMNRYSKNISISALEHLETIWLWALCITFNFRTRRLAECRKILARLKPLQMPYRMLELELNEVCKLKNRGGKKSVEFKWLQPTIEKLDITHDKFANGLVLRTKGVAV